MKKLMGIVVPLPATREPRDVTSFVHFGLFDWGSGGVQTRGGVTLAVTVMPGASAALVAAAVCSPKDEYRKARGREIALSGFTDRRRTVVVAVDPTTGRPTHRTLLLAASWFWGHFQPRHLDRIEDLIPRSAPPVLKWLRRKLG